MKKYIGCKVIAAAPQERDGQAGYKVVYPDGYVSWSPAKVFEAAYREIETAEIALINQDEAELA